MIIDIVLCVIILVLTLVQYRRGILYGLRGFLSFGGAGYLTYRFLPAVSAAVSERYQNRRPFAVVETITAIVLFLAFVLVLRFLLGLVTGAIRSTGVARKADSILGGMFGLLEGLVIAAAASAVLYGLNTCQLIHSASIASQIRASHLVSLVQGLASRVIIH